VETENAYPRYIDITDTEPHVKGTVTGFSEAPSKFGQVVVVNMVLDDDEERALWLSRTVLRQKVAELKPEIGETLEVQCLGQKEGAGGTYWSFKVTCPDRPAFRPDWSQLADEDDGIEP
jgi:hypothetical protein